MAVETGPVPTGKYMDSIARVTLMTDANRNPDDWTVTFHFENGPYDANGKLMGPTQFGTVVVEKRFGDIKDDPEILTLVGLIKKKAYAYREQKIQEDKESQERRAQMEEERLAAQNPEAEDAD